MQGKTACLGEVIMNPEQFCVVNAQAIPYRFELFHDTLDKAKTEALRLSQKEKKKFIVLKIVGYAEPVTPPAVWTDL